MHIKNTAAGPRGVRTIAGLLVFIEPGQVRSDLEVSADERDASQALGLVFSDRPFDAPTAEGADPLAEKHALCASIIDRGMASRLDIELADWLATSIEEQVHMIRQIDADMAQRTSHAKADEPKPPFLAKEKDGAPGWWQIYDAEGNEVGKAVRKDAAEAFNALDDEAKAAHVAALNAAD